MKIRITRDTPRFRGQSFVVGEVVDLPDHFAERLITEHRAVKAFDAPPRDKAVWAPPNIKSMEDDQ